MTAAASETFTTTSAPIQYAAVSAFSGSPEIREYVVASRRVLGALCKWSVARFTEIGIDCGQPEGGFYLFPDFGPLRERLAERGIQSSPNLCDRALEETGVAFLPGSCFGRPANELTARIAYVDFNGAAALAAAKETTELDEAFLRSNCGRVLTAIDLLCDWLVADGS